ncbi:hypothetical protein UNDKW_5949 (plasmid) [Undibacterium sp. KW1]|uniref:hypothetical protein n=1 Tax=Undibacterium sp. KW1 TaxID=2058624 RepID=UPI001331D2A3|nr:hypothetical protein [Undibacterium sp. KW1]BBB64222.1 hypothetical protein UNDKW_5949 [Undibacterium sp. KW1]
MVGGKGQCRVNPPFMNGWPKTSNRDWCLAWVEDKRIKPAAAQRKKSEPLPIGFDYTFVRDFPDLANMWLKAARSEENIPAILQPLIEHPLENLMTPPLSDDDEVCNDLLLWAEKLPGSGTPEELDDVGYRSVLTSFEYPEYIEECKQALASLPDNHPWKIQKIVGQSATKRSKKTKSPV